ncbi:DUF3368 domain-containing protein [Methanospirillum hungatei]|uniref:DUF3368 domain-containing protein n=1 Tax=Methanospirillum hungatei TaxID=2203 RepID=UPI0026ED63A2|nr:DUF3368 domain-containing protein [Methanospirillum hungatei]MCA1916493.1 DUF3368 domain-containing protein [Methanospirillum hungatei]
MILVFDSSQVIYFARAGALHLAVEIHSEKFIPPAVYAEVVAIGRAQGHPDAEVTAHLITQESLTLKPPEEHFLEKFSGLHRDLHPGEMEALVLSDELQGIAIGDDRISREIGEMFQIEVRGSAFILFALVKNRIISKEKAKKILQVMIREGFRIGSEQYGLILDLLEQLQGKNDESWS